MTFYSSCGFTLNAYDENEANEKFQSEADTAQLEVDNIITNGSFEDSFNVHSAAPKSWFDCGNIEFPMESPPDVHGNDTEFWEVKMKAQNGSKYLGLVSRSNYTWESVSNKLKRTLDIYSEYEMEISLTSVDHYMSNDRITKKLTNYNKPVSVSIWLSNDYCGREYLLYRTKEITDRDSWKIYNHDFNLSDTYSYLTIEVKPENKDYAPTNGNVLIDYISLKEKN